VWSLSMYCSLSIKYWWWRIESTSLSQNGSVYPWNLSSHWKSGDAVGSPSSQCELWAEHVLQGLALGIGGWNVQCSVHLVKTDEFGNFLWWKITKPFPGQIFLLQFHQNFIRDPWKWQRGVWTHPLLKTISRRAGRRQPALYKENKNEWTKSVYKSGT
jgi:hypothetical protein